MAAIGVILSLGIASLLLSSTSAHAVGSVRFGYSGDTGPERWGSLCPEYRLCSTGKLQSPINIVKEAAVANPALGPLHRDYAPTNATLVDNGFNVALQYNPDVGHVVVEGKNYSLIQMHWHLPSEHTINGKRFPVELHLVHRSDDGNITVVAILYRFGRPDPFIIQLYDKVAELAKEVRAGDATARVPVKRVQTRALRRSTRKYYRYMGSFTTPPCTENVIWNILGKVRQMGSEQAAELQAPLEEAFHRNARPTQLLNGRIVQLYDVAKRH